MFEKIQQEEKEKVLTEKLDNLDKKLTEVLKLIKENKNVARQSQNKDK